MLINALGCYYEDYYMNLAKLASTNSNCVNKVGAILTKDNQILTVGYNQILYSVGSSVQVQASVEAITDAIDKNYRIIGSILYVTDFPTKMCVETIIKFKIGKVIYQGDSCDEVLYQTLIENGVMVEKYDDLKNKVLMIRK